MNVREAVEEYEFATLRQSTKTRVWKFNKLKFFVEWCEKQEISDIKDIRPTHVRRFLDDMSHRQGRSKSSTETWEKKISSFTLRGYGQSVKGFLTWCRKEEYIDTDVSKRIELVKTDDKVIEIFTSEQMRALFDACKHEYNDRLVARDKAILAGCHPKCCVREECKEVWNWAWHRFQKRSEGHEVVPALLKGENFTGGAVSIELYPSRSHESIGDSYPRGSWGDRWSRHVP
jgi:integrase